MTGARIDCYDWAGGREAMLRFGPDDGPLVIAALPLFEEANRTRAFLISILRALAIQGIGSVLPDFPGTGESLVETRDITVVAMREAYAALVGSIAGSRPVYAVGIRSGALLDTTATVSGRWHLAPQTGEKLIRDLSRIAQASERSRNIPAMSGHDVDLDDYAGNLLSQDMLIGLAGISPIGADEGLALRTVRLLTDPRPADLKISGSPLWRRAEPGDDPALAERLAHDIVDWIATCEA